eukprot:5740105-Prymnesium_polylepis.1
MARCACRLQRQSPCHPSCGRGGCHERIDEYSLRDERVCAVDGAAVTRHHVLAEADELRGLLL